MNIWKLKRETGCAIDVKGPSSCHLGPGKLSVRMCVKPINLWVLPKKSLVESFNVDDLLLPGVLDLRVLLPSSLPHGDAPKSCSQGQDLYRFHQLWLQGETFNLFLSKSRSDGGLFARFDGLLNYILLASGMKQILFHFQSLEWLYLQALIC